MRALFSMAGILSAILLAACGGSEADGGGDGGNASVTSSSTCDGHASGDYECDGSYSYSVCSGGSWTYAGSCTCSVSVGDPRKPPYASNCKYHGTGSIECSYAGVACKICDSRGCH